MSEIQNLLNKKTSRSDNSINDNLTINYFNNQLNQIQDLSKFFINIFRFS